MKLHKPKSNNSSSCGCEVGKGSHSKDIWWGWSERKAFSIKGGQYLLPTNPKTFLESLGTFASVFWSSWILAAASEFLWFLLFSRLPSRVWVITRVVGNREWQAITANSLLSSWESLENLGSYQERWKPYLEPPNLLIKDVIFRIWEGYWGEIYWNQGWLS